MTQEGGGEGDTGRGGEGDTGRGGESEDGECKDSKPDLIGEELEAT